ncbi:hypothetical protein DFH09DRAFT_1200590 [Mycena vulgaris]|nr:hypothetical protein DFH09DRAFT_1200590 [Mycena vulgaris]
MPFIILVASSFCAHSTIIRHDVPFNYPANYLACALDSDVPVRWSTPRILPLYLRTPPCLRPPFLRTTVWAINHTRRPGCIQAYPGILATLVHLNPCIPSRFSSIFSLCRFPP